MDIKNCKKNKTNGGNVMKKIEKFKARRYYQRSYGLFADVERHEYKGETIIRLGSDVHIGNDMPVADRTAYCTFNTGRDHESIV